MKKIALLFTIACVGQLYGMESMEPTYHTLPKELQKEIINTALATSKSVDDAVNTIKALGTLHGMHYSTQAAMDLFIKTLPNDLNEAVKVVKNLQGTGLKDFTKLVHILADKFNKSTMEIAKKFHTPIADKYVDLTSRAASYMEYEEYDNLILLIKNGLDINTTIENSQSPFAVNNDSLLTYAASIGCSSDIIQLLLDAGANPYHKNDKGQTALDVAYFESIKPLIRDAMQKYPQK